MKKIAIILLLSILIFSGCKKQPQEPTVSYADVSLDLYFIGEGADVIDDFISDFTRDKRGLKINLRTFSDLEKYERMVLNELAEGEGPDILVMPGSWFLANQKKLAAMPENLGSAEDFENLFVPVVVDDLLFVSPEGRRSVFGVPLYVDNLALYYNKSHFNDKLPAQLRPSDTWEGIVEDAAVLSQEGATFSRFSLSGIALGEVENISNAVDIVKILALQYGANFYNQNFSESSLAGASAVSSAPFVDSVNYFLSFSNPAQKHYSWNEFVATGDENEIDSFAKGDVSMILGYSDTYRKIFSMAGDTGLKMNDVGIQALPQLSIEPGKRLTLAKYNAFGVSRNSKHADIAWDFILSLIKDDNMRKFFDQTGLVTSRRSLIEEQKVHPVYGVFANQVAVAKSVKEMDTLSLGRFLSEFLMQKNTSSKVILELEKNLSGMLKPEGLIYQELDLEAVEE